MKRPGRNRGAIYGAKSRGQSLGLRLVIRHGGHFFLCFGFAIRRRVLPGLLRAFGAEDGGHPAGASGQPFGFAGNVALLQLRQPSDVRRGGQVWIINGGVSIESPGSIATATASRLRRPAGDGYR